jgi:hypothetical protein
MVVVRGCVLDVMMLNKLAIDMLKWDCHNFVVLFLVMGHGWLT